MAGWLVGGGDGNAGGGGGGGGGGDGEVLHFCIKRQPMVLINGGLSEDGRGSGDPEEKDSNGGHPTGECPTEGHPEGGRLMGGWDGETGGQGDGRQSAGARYLLV